VLLALFHNPVNWYDYVGRVQEWWQEKAEAQGRKPIAMPLYVSQIPRWPAVGSSLGFRVERIVGSSLNEAKTASFHIHSDLLFTITRSTLYSEVPFL